MNFEQARINMIKQQFRPMGVVDENLLTLLAKTPREEFVPEHYQAFAFSDMNIPLDEHHSMHTPEFEARLLQALQIQPYDVVLEIGTGSGYVTAILAQLSQHVHSVDLNPERIAQAKARLNAHHISNITLEVGGAAQGWPQHAPYDVIVVHGSLPTLADCLQQQLQVGGRLFVVLGEAPTMAATLVTRITEAEWQQQVLFETMIPPLQTLEHKKPFSF